jgi:outer membrane protein assembly factor BamB
MSNNIGRPLRIAGLVCSMLSIAACGGGHGGGSTQPPASLVVTSTTISISAAISDPAPSALINTYISADPNATTKYYISGKYTDNGIASISGVGDGSAANYTIQFKSPASLGIGTYTDTVTVTGCYDMACTSQVQNSPQTVSVTYSVTESPPSLSSVSPATVNAGGGAFVLTAIGAGFSSTSTLEWNGSARPTTFISPTELRATIGASDIASSASVAVAVASSTSVNASLSNVIYVYIQTPPPPPVLSSLSPSAVIVGGGAFTLTVNGSNFTAASVVEWNGSARVTTLVSPMQLTAVIDASDVASVGSVPVTVASDATTGADISAPLAFTVQPLPPLGLNSIYPSVTLTGGSTFVLTALGQGFQPAAVVQWNGSARPTTYVSQTQLQAQIPATDVAAVGTASITVLNSMGAGTTSAPLLLTVKNPAPDAVAFQITPSHSGAVNFNSVTFPASSSWSVDVGGAPSYALIVDGKVIVTVQVGAGSQLIALDQATGATVWGPVVVAGNSNAAYDGGKILAISGTSGTTAFMQSFDGGSGVLEWSTLLAGQYAFSSAPTALNGRVFTGGAGSGGTLYALDEATGTLLWTQQVANGDDSTPAVTDTGVYVTYPCWTYAFQPATGNSVFNNDTGCDGGGGGTPVVANNVLYAPNGFGTYNGSTFNALTGALLGTYVADNPPAIGTQTGFFLQSGTLRGVTLANNTVIWSFTGDGLLVTSPIVVGQTVIIGSSSGNVYALDAATGTQVWTQNAGGAIAPGAGWGASIPLSGLAAGDGLLVVPAGNKVVAYVLSTNP